MEKHQQKMDEKRKQLEEEKFNKDPESYGAASHKPQLCSESRKLTQAMGRGGEETDFNKFYKNSKNWKEAKDRKHEELTQKHRAQEKDSCPFKPKVESKVSKQILADKDKVRN
mmetsp:Transcript_1411/g.1893  ORF Transcript_1411/g.1893 Transcript_1411/m.1893 type:complete len:113 (+) Transcript_1411:843-1181(+)